MSGRAGCPCWYWILVVAWCVVQGGGDWGDCGHLTVCVCKWSSGKKSASCPSAGLTTPPALSPDIQVLDLHDNALFALPSDVFSSKGLLNLQRVNLRRSRVRTIHADTFRDLRILVELDLGDNELKDIPLGTFRGNERLRLLVLSGNPLTSLPRDQFPPLPHMRNLDLADCQLNFVHSGALAGLKALESIDLRRNKLTQLRPSAFSSLLALKTLSISGNPWQCDCRLREFRKWYLSSNLGSEELLCTTPLQLANERWRFITGSNMTCAPEVTVSTRILRAEAGTDVSFGCFIRGDPKPVITWSVDGHEIYNDTMTSEVLIYENYLEASEVDLEGGIGSGGQWVNVTITNVTASAAGEWICLAKSDAGDARASISLVLPRARTATARSPPEYPPIFGVLAGTLGALFALGFFMTCACLHSKHRRVPSSRSFTDQEKKLLDTSIAASCDRSSADLGSLELPDYPMSLGVGSLPSVGEPVHITIEGTGGGAFPPPPAEFALPAPYGSIFISVSVAGREGHEGGREYPDLLGSVGGTTLPRRTRTCCAVPSYDNMGPRVTAAGSSTWSLPDSGAAEDTSVPSVKTLPTILQTPPSIILVPPPPPEFVSL